VPQPPALGPIISDPADGVTAVNDAIDFSAVFSDPDSPSGHIAVWDWGDGLSTTQNNVTSPVQASHAYSEPGIYTVTLSVTDPDNLSDSASYQFVVVYDPNGGFVTGGGWIDSPAGAYIADGSLSGKATFGFVSKYTKGKQAPTGTTEFQFKTAGLNFHSGHYYWLVVTGGDTAKFSGSGTINGQLAPNGDPYNFKIWANDGQPDTFHMRIWWEDNVGTEHVIYDNGAHQSLGGGSIVVHKGKSK
jgi:PKD repeat protein